MTDPAPPYTQKALTQRGAGIGEVKEALASIQADHDWAHDVLTKEIERRESALRRIADGHGPPDHAELPGFEAQEISRAALAPSKNYGAL